MTEVEFLSYFDSKVKDGRFRGSIIKLTRLLYGMFADGDLLLYHGHRNRVTLDEKTYLTPSHKIILIIAFNPFYGGDQICTLRVNGVTVFNEEYISLFKPITSYCLFKLLDIDYIMRLISIPEGVDRRKEYYIEGKWHKIK